MKPILVRLRIMLKKCVMKTSMSRIMTFGCDSDVPERNIALGYLFYIVLGCVLLCLPWATTDGSTATFIDHLFTVTSAVSTTGLATVDVPATYTTFGMVVILFLIQIGAIGYMTVSSFLMLHLTHKMTDRSSRVMGATITTPMGMSLGTVIDNIFRFTLLIEATGFVALWITFGCLGVSSPAWNALFISISSFCTAGFSTFPDSLCSFNANLAVNIIVAFLSYSGAMGFIVMTDIRHKLLDRHYRITFTSRVIISITCLMTVVGTAFLIIFPSASQSQDVPTRCLEAFFQTMSAMTTVGFNSFDLASLPTISALVLSMIMFIGASPSGTGGGMKSTTMSAVYAFVVSMLRGKKYVSLRGNRLPYYRVNQALTNIIVYGTVLIIGVTALTISDGFSFSAILFEATSALGTVGISLGITPELSVTGKIIVIALMYIGRIGVITLAAAMMSHAINHRDVCSTDIAV